MMIEGIIYKYTSPSGKVYIGQTIDEQNRRATNYYKTHKSSVAKPILQYTNDGKFIQEWYDGNTHRFKLCSFNFYGDWECR